MKHRGGVYILMYLQKPLGIWFGTNVRHEQRRLSYTSLPLYNAETCKIGTRKELVSNWFKSVTETGRSTRNAADPLNLRAQA